jgi:hypothetical protein
MLKRTLLTLAAITMSAALLTADDRGARGTAQTPAQQVASRVARLTVLLTLTTAQQTTATTIFTTEQTAITALDTPEDAARTALTTAIKANNATGIATQAAALGDIEKQEILAHANAQAAFYAQLTAAQRTTFDNIQLGGLDGDSGRRR